MQATREELLNLYDAHGRIVGAAPRRQAKASGQAVGAVNALIIDPGGRVLMQRRPIDKENGGRWDKSVGGHVSAGEAWDTTLVREAGEELFDAAGTPAVRLAASEAEFERLVRELDLSQVVLLRRVALQLNLRDVRRRPGAGYRNVLYHVAIYLGRTALALEQFRPQQAEIDELAYRTPAEIDRLLLSDQLAPNMAFLWLTQAHTLLQG